MYHHFTGTFTHKTPTYAVLECGGTGYLLQISLNTYEAIKNSPTGVLYAHQIVREDEIALFGFADMYERELFKALLTVSGVGPNTARIALSSLRAGELYQAIVGGDLATIKRIKGIGEKTAQKIIIDLKDKLIKNIGPNADAVAHAQANQSTPFREEALHALQALQLPRAVAEKAIEKVIKIHTTLSSTEELVRYALRALS